MVLVTALSIILVAVIAGTVLFVDRTLPPYDVAHEFIIDDLIERRFDDAARLLCDADQEDAESAIEEVLQVPSGDFNGRLLYSVNPLTVDRSGQVATVEYSVDPGAGPTRTYELPMREENGEWRVCPSDGIALTHE